MTTFQKLIAQIRIAELATNNGQMVLNFPLKETSHGQQAQPDWTLLPFDLHLQGGKSILASGDRFTVI